MKTRILPVATVVLGALGVSFAACAAQTQNSLPDGGAGTTAPSAGRSGTGVGGPGGATGTSGTLPYVGGSANFGGSGALGNLGGAAPTQGAAGSVVQAGAGAPPAQVGPGPVIGGCAAAVGTAADLLIDDLEDDNNAIAMLGQRAGFWYTYNDGSSLQIPPSGATLPFPPTAGGHSVNFSAHTSGPAFTLWGAGLGLDFNNKTGKPCPYNASAYSGIKFWAKGSPTVRATVKTPALIPVAAGGTCVGTAASACEDYFGMATPLTAAWAQYTLGFEGAGAVTQDTWGVRAAFDKTQILSVQFQVAVGAPFDFSIDDVTFY